MSNGTKDNPDRVDGIYRCITCREEIDAEFFYRDRTRYNGCGSRCKKCDNERTEARRDPRRQGFVGSAAALNAPRTSAPRWKDAEIKQLLQVVKGNLAFEAIVPEFPHKTSAMLRGKISHLKREVIEKINRMKALGQTPQQIAAHLEIEITEVFSILYD